MLRKYDDSIRVTDSGQIKRLTGYTAKPGFLSQITVDIKSAYGEVQIIFILCFSG